MTSVDDGRTTVCLDADVLIYAAVPRHQLGRRVRMLLDAADRFRLCGSALLLPQLLIKPISSGAEGEAQALLVFVGRIELWPATLRVCELAVTLGASYGLAAMDALHLASAVDGGAEVFLTNNRRDFDATAIEELDVVYPDELAV